MCGIAGMLGKPHPDVVQKMIDALATRGPDDQGLYQHDQVVLGHRRLSILDLSSAGHQPMSRADEQLWISYNGEVYNFQELRRDLEARGYRFQSNTDTEVILALYEAEGKAMVKRLRGIFALAIWDLRGSQPLLLLARDHFGIKPLVYARVGGDFLFASESRALLQSGLIPTDINRTGLAQTLLQGNVVQPRTLFSHITSLPPGHTMTLRPGGEPSIECYWDLDYAASQKLSTDMDYTEMTAEVRRRLEHAVRSQMISDVPVGAFLSGGVDSSTLVALMRRILNQPVKTYTLSFSKGDEAINESDVATRSAKALETEHLTEHVGDDTIADELPEIAWRMDQPTLDGPQNYLVSRVARRGVTVSLSGLGADELLAGYSSLWGTLDHYWKPATLSKQGVLSMLSATGLWKALPDSTFRDRWEATAMRRELTQVFGLWHNVIPPTTTTALLGMSGDEDLYDFAREADQTDLPGPTSRLVRLLSKLWLPSRCLRDADAGSMAHSLEVRVPFLDVDFAEFAYGLPDDAKWGRLTPDAAPRGKRILIDAVKDILPEWTYDQPKRGFFMPFDRWLRGPLRPLVEDTLASNAFRQRGMFLPAEVDRLWARFQKGEVRWAGMWIILMCELFMQRLDRQLVGADVQGAAARV